MKNGPEGPLCKERKKRSRGFYLSLRCKLRHSAHIWAKNGWDLDGSIHTLIVFQHGHQGAAHGQAGTIQGVQQLVLSGMVGKLVGTSDLGCQ